MERVRSRFEQKRLTKRLRKCNQRTIRIFLDSRSLLRTRNSPKIHASRKMFSKSNVFISKLCVAKSVAKDIRRVRYGIRIGITGDVYRDKEYGPRLRRSSILFRTGNIYIYIMKLNRLCDALSGVLFHQHELNARRHCACMEDHVKGDEGDHLN